MHVVEHADAAAFLARARGFLERHEAEHNLLLGVAGRLATASPPPPPEGMLFLTVEEDGPAHGGSSLVDAGPAPGDRAGRPAPIAALVRQRGYRAAISRGPLEAVDLLADAAHARLPDLPGVAGANDLARRFASRWRERAPSVPQRDGLALRVHELRTLREPPRPPGAPRVAGPADRALVGAWTTTFVQHTNDHPPPEEIERATDRVIAEGRLLLWEDRGAPRAMAARTRETARGAGVSLVYTPAEERGRGLASALTAEVTRRILSSGKEFCFLFTDLANPTSNAIYARLGYAPIADWQEVMFEPPGSGTVRAV